MIEQISKKVTPIAIVKDSRKLWGQIMDWEKAKSSSIQHHQLLMEDRKKQLQLLKDMAEAQEKEIIQLETDHSESVKQMDGAVA
eukprot:476332-Karenia_brevis.AAC.1